MRLPIKNAFRYIFTFRSFRFITVISTISLIGIAVGNAALISVLSIFNGFREFTEDQIVGSDPHLRITSTEGVDLRDVDSLLQSLSPIEMIEAASPVIGGRAIGIKGTNMQLMSLFAVRPDEIGSVSGISKTIAAGRFELIHHDITCNRNLPGIVLGFGLADKLKLMPGDTVSLMSPSMIEASVRTARKKRGVKAIVKGLFKTNDRKYDDFHAYTLESVGKKLFNTPDGAARSIDIRLTDPDNIEEARSIINKIIPPNTEVLTWQDLHRDLFNVMELERVMTFIVLSMIIIIAVFNVLASLTMTVVEKRADIGVFKAIGASDKLIHNIFLTEGIVIGTLSTAIGVVLGLAFCYGQIEFSWFTLSGNSFIVSAIPVSVKALDILIIAGFSLFLSFTAAIYPARRAAGTTVIEAIRSE
ncbi:MAG: ABC transporter permease [Candidatus Kapabacteria bacterium]|jgi:lipoprotein-releasing system permease protein|nr:ABC transporter permease [Candidatus Kapabacteria bacterium]